MNSVKSLRFFAIKLLCVALFFSGRLLAPFDPKNLTLEQKECIKGCAPLALLKFPDLQRYKNMGFSEEALLKMHNAKNEIEDKQKDMFGDSFSRNPLAVHFGESITQEREGYLKEFDDVIKQECVRLSLGDTLRHDLLLPRVKMAQQQMSNSNYDYSRPLRCLQQEYYQRKFAEQKASGEFGRERALMNLAIVGPEGIASSWSDIYNNAKEKLGLDIEFGGKDLPLEPEFIARRLQATRQGLVDGNKTVPINKVQFNSILNRLSDGDQRAMQGDLAGLQPFADIEPEERDDENLTGLDDEEGRVDTADSNKTPDAVDGLSNVNSTNSSGDDQKNKTDNDVTKKNDKNDSTNQEKSEEENLKPPLEWDNDTPSGSDGVDSSSGSGTDNSKNPDNKKLIKVLKIGGGILGVTAVVVGTGLVIAKVVYDMSPMDVFYLIRYRIKGLFGKR